MAKALLILSLVLNLTTPGVAQESPPATVAGWQCTSLLPRSGVVAYAEIQEAGRAIRQLQDSRAREALSASPQFAAFQASANGSRFAAGIQIAETYLGRDLWAAADELLGDRIAVALIESDNQSQPDLLAAVRFRDEKLAEHYSQRLLPVLELLPGQWLDDDTNTRRFRRINARLYIAVQPRWLMISTKESLLRHASGEADNVSSNSDLAVSKFREQGRLFQPELEPFSANRLLTGAVDLKWIRRQRDLSGAQRLDNPLLSLLVGQFPHALATADRSVVTFDLRPSGIDLSFQLQQPDWSAAPWNIYAAGPGSLRLPEIPGLVGGFSLSRDFAGWYGAREELLAKRTLPGFDKFETGLSNLLPGRDFQQDVLPHFGPRTTILAALQDYEHLGGKPGLQLPAFGMIVEMTDPDQAADLVTLFFQTVSAILNIQAGQQGRQPWVISSESHHDVQLTFARYLEQPTGDRLPIVFNFMPASARVGKYYLLTSSRQLCRELIDAVQATQDLPAEPGRDLHLELHGATLREILHRNSAALLARSIREGQSREAARENLDLLLSVIGQIQKLEISAGHLNDALELRLGGTWR